MINQEIFLIDFSISYDARIILGQGLLEKPGNEQSEFILTLEVRAAIAKSKSGKSPGF